MVARLTRASILAAAFALPLPWSGMSASRVDEKHQPRIGNVPQRIIARGHGARSPLVIIVHGGPGTDEGPLFRSFTSALEHERIVVYWEQRGTGRSYSRRIPPSTMTIDRFVADLSEVVEFASNRYRPGQQVILISHSWGGIPAMRYAAAHPDRVQAHIAISPVLDAPRAEAASWAWALQAARQRGHHKGVEELLRAGRPPQSVEAMLVTRRWVERLGGTFHGDLRTRNLIFTALKDPYVNAYDLVRFGQGNAFSLKHLWPQIRQVRWPASRTLGVPTLFVVGRHDRVTPTHVTLDVIGRMDAPCKRILVFEESAHNAPFEEPARFVSTVRDLPRWLANCGSADVDAGLEGAGTRHDRNH